ncbi:PH domain-containing protein [Ornithinimicrobium cryptoxanthini]|uniref:PH domain-containing protein n=1 Tax=Ornithinimicrobium cryptoxanthini TaxID=2934161 RepID=A0ABY4YED1_9MICO|nr:PH domain-containing protein [Ornithinimicrobium cryptoxanthini]USQ74957.1 PH domain-containing protein [Ornithinimicrobium cryptoxanthini]
MTTKDPYAEFRPRRGALVARGAALATVAVLGGLALLAPGDWAPADRVLLFLFGLLAAAGLWRFGMVRALASADGLLVVNLVHARQLEWAEILRVSFADGTPWVLLELADTEELAVMGIQRADGAFARAEAARLAALVQHHSS